MSRLRSSLDPEEQPVFFVGSAGFSNRLERFVLGSVSAAVAARAHCSVEVVRLSVGEKFNAD